MNPETPSSSSSSNSVIINSLISKMRKTMEKKVVGEGMLNTTRRIITTLITKHESSKRKRIELGHGILSKKKKKKKKKKRKRIELGHGILSKKKKRKINEGTARTCLKRKRNHWISSKKKKKKGKSNYVDQLKLLSKRKRSDVEDDEEEDVNLSKRRYGYHFYLPRLHFQEDESYLSRLHFQEDESYLSRLLFGYDGDEETEDEEDKSETKEEEEEDKSETKEEEDKSETKEEEGDKSETKEEEEGDKSETKEEEDFIRIGDTVNLSDLVFTTNRDYLITCNHHNTTNKLVKVKAKDLAGKSILLHFMYLNDYVDTWSWKAPLANIKDIYTKLHPKGDFEIVFVALRNDHAIPSTTRQCIRDVFSMMPPCPAVPLSDQKSIQRLERIFGIHHTTHIGPTSFIIDPTGVVLQSHATPLFLSYGAAAYPFTNERIQFLDSENSLVRTQPLSVEKLLSSPDRDYLINNKGDQVPLHYLDEMVVGLYFCPCLDRLDGLRTTRKLEMVYQELLQKRENFEIVLVYTHGWCEHEDTCCLIDEDSFQHEIKTMPWLALPFEDTNCIKKLQRVFQYPQGLDWPRPDARLVIIGPHGEYFEPLGTHILSTYGAPAYPFTLPSAVNLELERAKKVKPDMLWELDAVFTRSIGSQVRFSQFVGKRIIVFYENYETREWVYTNTLRELTARYLEMKGTDDEFEVIHIDKKPSTRIKAPVPWLMHPPFDKDTPADSFLSCVFGIKGGLLAFDSDGSVVRVSKFPQLGDSKSFPFYHNGDMETEVLLDVKKKIAHRLERVYGVNFDHDD